MNSCLQIVGNLLMATPENSGMDNKLLLLNNGWRHSTRAAFAINRPIKHAKLLL